MHSNNKILLSRIVAASIVRCVIVAYSLPLCAQSFSERTPSGSTFKFEIPKQPLKSALDIYATVTGTQTLYDPQIIAGKTARGVSGQMTKETAIAALLDGTDLIARSIGLDAVTIEASNEIAGLNRPLDAATYNFRVALQDAVESKLCENALSVPGTYRAAVEILVDQAGVILEARLLSSTGEMNRDAALQRQLSRLSIGVPIPAGTSNRIVLLILPRSSVAKGGCHLADPQGDR